VIRRGAFAPHAICAIDPRAWGMIFDAPEAPANVRSGDVSIVSIRGPLMHHEDWLCDSYDAIKARVLEALAEKPGAVILSIDSPGGIVSGCFDTAAEIRDACAAAGIPLYAYVDGAALSAGYALACAASRIAIPPTGAVGSIGIVDMMVDATAQDAAHGIRAEIVASGVRKSDGNPHAPITDDAIAAVRINVEALAGVFFEHVALSRSTSADAMRSLQAAIVTGSRAVAMGLADEVASLDQMLASIAGGTFEAPGARGDETMGVRASKAYEDAIAALRKCASGDDEEERAKAKRMLAAELAEDDAPPPKDDEPDGDEPAPEGKAEGDETDGGEPKKDEESKALSSRMARIEAVHAAYAKTATEAERARLLSTRPDLDEPTKALLASASVADVKAYVEQAPRRALKPAATAVVGGTLAEGQGEGTDRLPPGEAHQLDVQMGLASASAGIKVDGNRQILGVMTRAQARAELERRAAKN